MKLKHVIQRHRVSCCIRVSAWNRGIIWLLLDCLVSLSLLSLSSVTPYLFLLRATRAFGTLALTRVKEQHELQAQPPPASLNPLIGPCLPSTLPTSPPPSPPLHLHSPSGSLSVCLDYCNSSGLSHALPSLPTAQTTVDQTWEGLGDSEQRLVSPQRRERRGRQPWSWSKWDVWDLKMERRTGKSE